MHKSKLLWMSIAFLLFAGGLFLVYQKELSPRKPTPITLPEAYQPPPHQPEEGPREATEKPDPNTPIPAEFRLQVPFTAQAPTANWDELHNEACEEASVLMAAAFFEGDTRSTLPPSEAEAEITKLTQWQQENLGYYLSINAGEVVRMIKSVYGLKAEVVTNFSEESLKRALVSNKLILVPVNGRELGNPYFRQPGPIYHMLVITGYTKNQFIVNEPGTKRGQDYLYSYQTIRGAVGDYDHEKKETDPEKPAIIVVSE